MARLLNRGDRSIWSANGSDPLLSHLIKCVCQVSWKTDWVASIGYRAHVSIPPDGSALLQVYFRALVGARHARDSTSKCRAADFKSPQMRCDHIAYSEWPSDRHNQNKWDSSGSESLSRLLAATHASELVCLIRSVNGAPSRPITHVVAYSRIT